MQVNSAPENTFLNEIWPFQGKKEKLVNFHQNQQPRCFNRQDGAHELPEVLIPKEKRSRDAQNGYLKAEEN